MGILKLLLNPAPERVKDESGSNLTEDDRIKDKLWEWGRCSKCDLNLNNILSWYEHSNEGNYGVRNKGSIIAKKWRSHRS